MATKILIIEDDTGAAELAYMILSKEGYEIAMAADGEVGVSKARSFVPDLALVDLMLPRIHGYEVCERIRADKELAHVKILVCSAKAYTQDIDGAIDAGADDYLRKPYKVDELLSKIKRLLESAQGEKGPDSPNAQTPSSPA